jgi:hypothetical protein
VRAAWVVAAASACATGHVDLRPLPPNPTPQERVALFNAYKPTGLAVDLGVHCAVAGTYLQECTPTVDNTSLMLGSVEVRRPEDLLPVVAESSESAKQARAAQTASDDAELVGIGGLGLAVIGALVWVESRSDDSQNIQGSPTAQAVGLTRAATGVAIAALGSWLFHARAEAHMRAAFATYRAGLAERLQICFTGFTAYPCEQGRPAH